MHHTLWYQKSASQTLFVAKGHDNPHLFKRSLSARDLHWINEPLQIGDKINCKIRYRQTNQTAIITKIDQQRIEVLFDEAQHKLVWSVSSNIPRR